MTKRVVLVAAAQRVFDSIGYAGACTGHDEPAVLFYSDTPGSGNNDLYSLTLPKDPPTRPLQNGKAGRSTSSSTRPSGSAWPCATTSRNRIREGAASAQPCPAPRSDANIYDSSNPADAHYIGLHPGTAFLEVQFYPPGWVAPPFLVGPSCSATQCCAAMTIDSLAQNLNTGQQLNDTCALRRGAVRPAAVD
jgi:hypothetical protein